MENLSNWEIVGIIVLVLIFGGLVIRIAKSLFKYILIAALVLVGIYFVKPELLNDWFGKENVEKVEQTVKDTGEELKPHVKEGVKKIGEALDSVENKL